MIKVYDVICCGSSTIDVFGDTSSELIRIKTKRYMEDHICYPSGVKLLLKDLNFQLGGGGINTALAMVKLGLKVAYLGAIGKDANGDLVISKLKKNKIDFIGVRDKNQTGYAIILDSLIHDRTILKYSGANNHLYYKDINKNKLKTKWFYLTSMVEESFKTLERLAKFAKINGIKVAFNPSNYVIKDYLSHMPYIISKCDLFVCNETEAYILTGLEGKKKQLQAIKRMGAKNIVVTCGGEGASYTNGKDYVHIESHHINVIEVTGAGDTFGSTFVTALMKVPKDFRYALKLAMSNAESVITKMGAQGGLLTFEKAHLKTKNKFKIKKL